MRCYHLLHLLVLGCLYQCIGITHIVCVGAQILNHSGLDVVKAFLFRRFAVKTIQRQDVDLEEDAHLFHLFHLLRVDAKIGVALGVGEYQLVAKP